jgi:predicted HicB family RNase H-like nuclease
MEKPKYYDEKSKARTMKYMKENRDRLTVWVQKGDRDRYKQQAESKGLSLNAYIIKLLEEDKEKASE